MSFGMLGSLGEIIPIVVMSIFLVTLHTGIADTTLAIQGVFMPVRCWHDVIESACCKIIFITIDRLTAAITDDGYVRQCLYLIGCIQYIFNVPKILYQKFTDLVKRPDCKGRRKVSPPHARPHAMPPRCLTGSGLDAPAPMRPHALSFNNRTT